MFSYRHGFHAGNHADVLKHTVLVQLLDYLTRKDKALWIVDTHAGAGAYALEEGFAAQRAEFDTGITRLWDRTDLPDVLEEYRDQIRVLNPDGVLRHYPGSPQIALQMSRSIDRLRLFELHPTEGTVLKDYFASAGRRVAVAHSDGYAGLKATLPPPSRRALVLIDPSYEDKTDYAKVVEAMRDALQRFATGVYAVWYPQVQRRESILLPQQLQQIASGDWMHVSLQVKTPSDDGIGLHGSGMFVFNPPWKLEAALRPVMHRLVEWLGQDSGAKFELNFRQT